MKDNGIPTDALESGKKKLLIVDDDQDLVDLMRDTFERDGRFDIRTANNGFDAGMQVKEFRPDLVVLDVMLPDINGREVCQRVRSDRTMDTVKILCISGMVESDKIADLRMAGADDFMQKPFTTDRLLERVCDQLEIDRPIAMAG
jgi:DNA-binding response OmpR family regulator